ncbi:MAG: GNAT family N-acetyltransferase [Thermoanaerobaculia bacterium]
MRGPVAGSELYPLHRELLTEPLREGRYEVRFARNAEELDAIQRLRFEVFNLELGEGLAASFETGRDVDRFDPVCHHLMVSDLAAGEIVGCYRLQTAAMAAENLGFYSAWLFDLSALPGAALARSVELGRACIAGSHRSSVVLFLLWKGLAHYVAHNQLRYLFGCCSLTSQDPAEGSAVLRYLEERGHLHPTWRLRPAAGTACPIEAGAEAVRALPPLFLAYLRYGAKVCGPPAIDREFKTIDYLVVLDVDTLSRGSFELFFG